MSVQIKNLSNRPIPDFDFLGQEAAALLSDLLPGSIIELVYAQAKSGESINVSSLLAENVPGWIEIGNIAGAISETNLWRGVTILIPERARKFISPAIELRELKYALSITWDVANSWLTTNIPIELVEIRQALALEYRQWAIAHIIADRVFDFSANNDASNQSHDKLAGTLRMILDYFDSLASTRVEHQELSMGILITNRIESHESSNRLHFPYDFRKLKRTPLLANGKSTVLEVTADGMAASLITRKGLQIDNSDGNEKMNLVELSAVVRKGVGLQLDADGTISVYTTEPVLTRRAGKWRGLFWKSLSLELQNRYGDLGLLLFDIARRLSFSGRGGILAISPTLPEGILMKDDVIAARNNHGSDHIEWGFHRLLPDSNIQNLESEFLVSLASIDGATIVSPSGQLLAYGAVVPNKPGGSEGARTSAAKALSEFGLVLKISADGPITIYEESCEVLET